MPIVGQEEEHSKLKFSCTSAFDGYLMMSVSSTLIIILGEGVAESGGGVNYGGFMEILG